MGKGDIQGSYGVGWHLFRATFRIYFRWRVYHPERVPAAGPVIIAANHASYLDPPLVASGIDRMLRILARESLFRFPVFGALLRSWHAVPVDNKGGGVSGLKMILTQLRENAAVLVFPEGTRSEDGQLLPARSGLGLAILQSKAVVVPARVWGTHEAYGKKMKVPRPHRITLKYGMPMTFDAERARLQTASRDEAKLAYQAASERVMQEIARLQPCRDTKVFP